MTEQPRPAPPSVPGRDAGAPFGARSYGESARTVILGHGFGTTQSAWDQQVPALVRAGFRVVVYDLAGASAATLDLYQRERHGTIFGFAEDLVALVGGLDLRGAAFVGHSVSGLIGILAANAEPGLFGSLVLIGSSARYIDDPETGYVGGFTAAQVDGLAEAMRRDYVAWANGFAPIAAGNLDRPHLGVNFCRCLLALKPDIAADLFPSILRVDHRRDAQACRVPALVLQTAKDPAVPLSAAQWLADAVKAPAPIVIDTDGHFPHISAPEQVSRHVIEFLAGSAGR